MSVFTTRVASLSVVGVLAAATLTGCGGGSSSSSTGTPQAGAPSGGPGGFGINTAQQKKIQQCLKAAGLASSFPSGRPSGFPSGGANGTPPSGVPSGAPSGFPSGGPSGGPGGGAFNNPQIQAALKACGITLPQRPTASANAG
jgi:hypothetical protein